MPAKILKFSEGTKKETKPKLIDGAIYKIHPNGLIFDEAGNLMKNEDVETRISKKEIEFLKQLCEIAGQNVKGLSDFNICLDLIGQLESIEDDPKEISLDERDVKLLKEKGFENTENKRNHDWFVYCREIIKQLN
jgi:hypothetical protein